MNDENEILEAETIEKEVVDAEIMGNDVVEEDNSSSEFDPNVILNTIMQSQDVELRNVVTKLSTLNMSTKATVVLLLFKILNFVGLATLLYSLYSAIYLLVNYNKVKEKEYLIKDLMSKDGQPVNIKKTVMKSLFISLACIPLAALSFWYYYIFQAS